MGLKVGSRGGEEKHIQGGRGQRREGQEDEELDLGVWGNTGR